MLSPLLVAGFFLSVAAVAHAEEPGKVDLEAAEMVAEPVLAKDGTEVGQVASRLMTNSNPNVSG